MKRDITSDEAISLLRHADPALHQAAVVRLRARAIRRLHAACKRHMVKPADLLDNDKAVALYHGLRGDPKASPVERSTGELLRWCVYGLEQGVDDLAKLQIGYALAAVDTAMAALGEVFSRGRAKGTVGPLRRAIREVFESSGVVDNRTLWDTLKSRSRDGLTFNGKAGDSLAEVFIDGVGSKDYETYFCNRASEERTLLKKKQPKGFTE